MAVFWSGYPIELEDREYLRETALPMTFAADEVGDIPAKIDPRSALKVENQGPIGSCQGHALTTCMEFCLYVASGGDKTQLSRGFAYLMSQKFDGISGDSGSTLSGGWKVASQSGCCREEVYPYFGSYPRNGWRDIPAKAFEDAPHYKLRGHVAIESEEQARLGVAAGLGIIEIGIAWGSAMTPDAKGCIKSFKPGGGGHAIVLAGWVPDDEVGAESGAGYWWLLGNSWGERWGRDGWAYVAPKAVSQMLQHRWTTMQLLTDMHTIQPRKVDWQRIRFA
jgi:hypothetical protein